MIRYGLGTPTWIWELIGDRLGNRCANIRFSKGGYCPSVFIYRIRTDARIRLIIRVAKHAFILEMRF